jgi:sulfonate transport system permease protein
VTWLGRARGLGGILIFLALWEAAIRLSPVTYDTLPGPIAVTHGLLTLLSEGEIFEEILHTLSATFLGWAIACVVGLVLGTALGLSALLRSYAMTTIEVLRPVPAVAMVPIALLLFGYSVQTELFVIVLPSIWPVLINTMVGIQAVPNRLRDVADALKFGPVEKAWKVLIPASAASVLVGCRVSLGLALVLAIISEMVGNPQGLGNAVVWEGQALRPDAMFAYICVIGFLGIVFNFIINAIAKLLLPGEFRRPSALRPGGR